jgi:signal transduction histidine kinase
MDKKPFDMKAATEEVVATLTSDAHAKGLALKLEIPDGADYTVNGDREKIVQHVIRNLIDNSIRYTPSGTITVSLLGGVKSINTKDTNAKILLTIKDTGIGITPEDMSNLFTEGGHGKDSVKVNVHSTGYGLFFAKNIVDANGGKIWAESEGAGKGSQFHVELPAA